MKAGLSGQDPDGFITWRLEGVKTGSYGMPTNEAIKRKSNK